MEISFGFCILYWGILLFAFGFKIILVIVFWDLKSNLEICFILFKTKKGLENSNLEGNNIFRMFQAWEIIIREFDFRGFDTNHYGGYAAHEWFDILDYFHSQYLPVLLRQEGFLKPQEVQDLLRFTHLLFDR